uniref:DHC_N1 domain-containing protein n=1 Tax=Soboliphyme baturini TaxID=241478 RepID=A0A183I8V1_9BILA
LFVQGVNEPVNIGCVLSIGTGRIPDVPIEALNLDSSNPLDILNTFKNLGRIILEQVSAAEGRPVDRSKAWCHQANIPFFRFSTPMSKDFLLDTKDDKDLVLIMWETLEYMYSQVTSVLSLVRLLELTAGS